MIIPNKHNGYSADGTRLYFLGGGGGGPTQTTSTVTNSNIPAYAQPYVESMLGATQKQLFQGNTDSSGNFNITGFQPYKSYGGTYAGAGGIDPTTGKAAGVNPKTGQAYQEGDQLSYDPSKGIAGFQPLQQTAQQGIQNMQMPGQYDTAANTTQEAMNRAMGMQYNPAAINVQQAAAPNLQDYQMGPAREVSAQQVGTPTMDAAQTGYNPQLQNYQMGPAQQVSSQGINAGNINAAQMGPAERVDTQSFTQPGSAAQYMSPYMQNVVETQKREAARQSGIQGTQQQAQAAQAGAFGGGRDAIMRAERERNLGTQMNDIQAQGSNAAFQQAQQQFNAEQQARLAAQQSNQQAGLTTGMQNLNAQQQANVQNAANQLQAQGMNSQQALQAALANQQAGLTTGSQNLAANLGIQQLGTQTGLQTSLANLSNQQQAAVQNQAAQLQAQGMNAQQAMQAALANQQAGLTVGGQNLNAKLGIQQLGSGQNMQAQLANQQALAQAQQLQANQQQFGANYGLQGIQAGMAGANQLANIGGQKLQAQQGIYGLQNQYGTQQQQLEQQKLNQAQQDYANAQQYPMMQLGAMSNMLRGLPMQSTTSQMYQAQPNALTQGIGAAGSMASLYNAYNAKPGGAAGGLPSEFKYASGGITAIPRYDVGGQVMGQLQQMDDQSLAREAKESPSPEIKRMAQAILKQRQAGMNMENAPQPQQDMGMAGGGIIAFADGRKVDETEAARLANQTRMYIEGAQTAAAERQAQEAATAADADTPMGMGTPPRPGLKKGIDALLGGIASKVSRPVPSSMMLDATETPVATANGIAAPTPATAPKAAPAAPQAGPARAPRAAPAAAPNSIMAAAPKTPPELLDRNAPAYSGPAEAPADTAAIAAAQVDPFTAARDALAKAQTEAGKTTEDVYKSDLAAKKALGLDQNEAQQDYMKKVMAQKSNIAEDAEQRKYLRLAEFFASWGSTPGDTLVAGMSALKAKIPDMIADVKERRKAEADADKVMYELGQAKRQEDLGNWDKAESKKIEASKMAAKLQESLTTATASYEGHKLTSAATVKAAEIGERSHRYTAEVGAAANTRGHEIAAEAQNFATRAHMAQTAAMERGRVDTNGTKLFDYNLGQLNGLREKLSNVLNTGLGKELSAKILAAASAPDNPTMQNIAKEAKTQLDNMTRPIVTQIESQQKIVDTVGKKVFKADWNVPSPSTSELAPTMNPVDKQALEWANKNPSDPRAAAIKQKLGQ